LTVTADLETSEVIRDDEDHVGPSRRIGTPEATGYDRRS
jgi:hypothetical protein